MIPIGVKVLVASQPVDFRKGPDGLLALVRDAGSDPFSGALFVFRAKRADRVKIVWWDGSGVCLYSKRLEKAQFVLAPCRAATGPVEPCAVAGAGRRHGLAAGADPVGPGPALSGLRSVRHDESGRSKGLRRGLARCSDHRR